jgi:hypothetical protein
MRIVHQLKLRYIALTSSAPTPALHKQKARDCSRTFCQWTVSLVNLMRFLRVLGGLSGTLVCFFTVCGRSCSMLFGRVVVALIGLVSRLKMVMCGGGVVGRRGQMSCSGRMLGSRPFLSFSTRGLRRRCHVCDPL